MRWTAAIAAAALLAGCQQERTTRNVDAMLDADFTTGAMLLTCRASSTGACHAMLLTNGASESISAAPGNTASAQRVGADTLYCVDVAAPDPATCRPRPLKHGAQIVRSSTVEN